MNKITKIITPFRYMLTQGSIMFNNQKYSIYNNAGNVFVILKNGRINEITLHDFCNNCIELNDKYVKTIIDVMRVVDDILLSGSKKNLLMLFYILLKGKKFNGISIDKNYYVIQNKFKIPYYTMGKFLKDFQNLTYKEFEYIRGLLI